jgi:V/A-type H+-transporting ATPase subunit D
LNFAVKGEHFLEFKREQLIAQIKDFWSEYLQSKNKFIYLYRQALYKLYKSYKEMGKIQLNLISNLSKIQHTPIINVRYKKKIGLIVPEIIYELKRERELPAYSFENTSHYCDELITILRVLFEVMLQHAEREDLLLKVALSFKKINRRINGLKNLVIPNLESDIKQIKDILEETEREGFVRLKKVKNLIINK